MDSLYEYAGAGAASSMYDVLSALGLPLIVACAGLAWRFHRVAEDGLARPLAVYILSLLLIAWLIRPVEVGGGLRSPRFVHYLGSASDTAVKGIIRRIDRDFLTRPFEYERVAALAGQSRVLDPEARKDLTVFLSSCTANAMARTSPIPERALQNPLAQDSGLRYQGLTFGGTGEDCDRARTRILNAIHFELDRHAIHRAVIEATGEAERGRYLSLIIRNEWHGRVADGGEMALVRRSVGDYTQGAAGAASRTAPLSFWEGVGKWWKGEASMTEVAIRWGGYTLHAVAASLAANGQASSDLMSSKQRYYVVTAHAPVIYGLILMLLTAFFPLAGIWALFPGKWRALLNYGKVFVSVKLWPVGWALISSFTSRRPLTDALTEDASGGDVFVASTLLYFMIPALTFILVNLAATAAAAPLQAATPPLAGPGNGVAGAVVRVAVQRMT